MKKTSIDGLHLLALSTIPDERGFFREVLKVSAEFSRQQFGQLSHSKMVLNTLKAWHFHHQQIDWWYVPVGVICGVFYDHREESTTRGQLVELYLGDTSLDARAQAAVVQIPPGVLHGCKALAAEAHILYMTSEPYNPSDEGRLPYDSDLVPYEWGDPADLVIAANDRKTTIPSLPRTLGLPSLRATK